MRVYSIIIYIIFSIILELILNKLEHKNENNFLDYVLISNIYLLILSGIFIHHKSNIFLVVLFQTIGNVLYITCIKEISLMNNGYDNYKYVVNVIVSYLLNVLFINKVNSVFLNLEQFKLLLWFFIFIYLYFYLKNNIKLRFDKNRKYLYYQDREYIVMQYAKFKNKYCNEISIKDKELVFLIYSMMIYENYNKPKFFRKLEKYSFFNKNKKYGIMQVDSDKYIDDISSIKLVIKKIEKIYLNKRDIYKTINTYYKNNNEEVFSIYNIIIDFDKK